MKSTTWTVTKENGVRPAGKPDECFYCKNKLNEEHAKGCVLRKKTVVVRLVMEYCVEVPEWDSDSDVPVSMDDVESPSDYFTATVQEWRTRQQALGNRSQHPSIRMEYVRQANADDHAVYGIATDADAPPWPGEVVK